MFVSNTCRTRGTFLPLVLAATLGLTACDDAPVAVNEPAPETVEIPRWLPVTDNTPAPLFLARVETGRPDLGSDSAAAARYDRLLAEARQIYTETPRMIANRLIQGSDYLAETGDPVPPDRLLTEIERVGTMRPRSFADDLHHYLNLRDGGAGHEAAIAALAERVGGG